MKPQRGLLSLAMCAAMAVPLPAIAQSQYEGLDMAPDKAGGAEEMLDMAQFCGTEPIRVAFSVGFGSNYWRRINRAEFEDEAAKCPNIVEIAYTDGEFRPEKQIADIQGLIARQFDVIIITPDAGEAIFRAIQQATASGVIVVVNDVGDSFPGEAGVDYLSAVRINTQGVGATSAEWMANALGGKGNLIFYTGTPGASYSEDFYTGVKEVLAKYPDMKLLEDPVVTNWDPALAQQATTALLAKHPQIDGLFSETSGPIRAFQAAGRPIPAWAGQDLNETSCLWQDLQATNPDFKIGQLSAHTWSIRIALRKGVAAAQGLDNTEPSIVQVPISEDSTSDDPALAVKCNKDMPPDSIPSAMLSDDVQRALLNK